ncbi:hypothetical protein BJX99DRAFT_91668 [Aspergillus californicus]
MAESTYYWSASPRGATYSYPGIYPVFSTPYSVVMRFSLGYLPRPQIPAHRLPGARVSALAKCKGRSDSLPVPQARSTAPSLFALSNN